MAKPGILVVTRSPTVHQLGGSTTVVVNLLRVLAATGAPITLLVTSAYSRSPRLLFRDRVALPAGVRLLVPGFVRIGPWYLNLFSVKAWVRAILRACTRVPALAGVIQIILAIFRGSLTADAWDLTTPTKREMRLCLSAIARGEAATTTVVANYAFWAPLFERKDWPADVRRVVLMHDLLSSRIRRFIDSGVPLDCIFISEETELAWLSAADFVLAAQRAEAETIRKRTSANVLVQPIVIEVRAADVPPAQPTQCLFVGTNIQPNVHGISWFLESVWPLVLTAKPDATLRIAGTVCSMLAPTHPNVTLLGIVDSLTGEMDRAGVCIVPLLVGSGIKVKLLEALAWGKACVATPVGIQGLEEWADGAMLTADDAETFAAAVLSLMNDEPLRKRIEAGARHLMQQHFSTTSEAARDFAAAIFG